MSNNIDWFQNSQTCNKDCNKNCKNGCKNKEIYCGTAKLSKNSKYRYGTLQECQKLGQVRLHGIIPAKHEDLQKVRKQAQLDKYDVQLKKLKDQLKILEQNYYDQIDINNPDERLHQVLYKEIKSKEDQIKQLTLKAAIYNDDKHVIQELKHQVNKNKKLDQQYDKKQNKKLNKQQLTKQNINNQEETSNWQHIYYRYDELPQGEYDIMFQLLKEFKIKYPPNIEQYAPKTKSDKLSDYCTIVYNELRKRYANTSKDDQNTINKLNTLTNKFGRFQKLMLDTYYEQSQYSKQRIQEMIEYAKNRERHLKQEIKQQSKTKNNQNDKLINNIENDVENDDTNNQVSKVINKPKIDHTLKYYRYNKLESGQKDLINTIVNMGYNFPQQPPKKMDYNDIIQFDEQFESIIDNISKNMIEISQQNPQTDETKNQIQNLMNILNVLRPFQLQESQYLRDQWKKNKSKK